MSAANRGLYDPDPLDEDRFDGPLADARFQVELERQAPSDAACPHQRAQSYSRERGWHAAPPSRRRSSTITPLCNPDESDNPALARHYGAHR